MDMPVPIQGCLACAFVSPVAASESGSQLMDMPSSSPEKHSSAAGRRRLPAGACRTGYLSAWHRGQIRKPNPLHKHHHVSAFRCKLQMLAFPLRTPSAKVKISKKRKEERGPRRAAAAGISLLCITTGFSTPWASSALDVTNRVAALLAALVPSISRPLHLFHMGRLENLLDGRVLHEMHAETRS